MRFSRDIMNNLNRVSVLCYLPKPKAEADNTDLGFAMIIHYIMLNLIQ